MQLWVVETDPRIENVDLSGVEEIAEFTRFLGRDLYFVEASEAIISDIKKRPGVNKAEPITHGTFVANDGHVYKIIDRGSRYSRIR